MAKRQTKAEKENATKSDRPPALKKTRSSKATGTAGAKWSKTRGRRGFLQQISQTPLDVLFEIFGYLEPLDILRLSRTTKDLRSILMSRSSVSVWKAARSNIPDLPPLPEDLTEPQYANLAFDAYCHICLAIRCETIMWQCHIRCCKRCIDSTFSSSNNLVQKYNQSRGQSVFGKIHKYIPHYQVEHKGHWGGELFVFLPSIADQYNAEYLQVKDEPAKLKDWIQVKMEKYRVLAAHDLACIIWKRSQVAARGVELQKIRLRRREAILAKLRSLGWGKEIDKMSSSSMKFFSEHKLVSQSKDLTVKGWEKIEWAMIKLMKEQRALRAYCPEYPSDSEGSSNEDMLAAATIVTRDFF
ncbi:hypothetical protein C8J56DRAFT_936110 [Mycena floridula]|nr:hypothetical protein C8J56DRAFT_936110 [Mycena floridula]